MQVGWGDRGGACRVIINWLVMRLLPLPQWGTFSDWLSYVCYMHVQCSHTGTYMYTHTHVRVHTQRHTHTDSGNNTCINPKTLIGLKWTFSISLHCVTFDLHCEKRAQTNSRKTRERVRKREGGGVQNNNSNNCDNNTKRKKERKMKWNEMKTELSSPYVNIIISCNIIAYIINKKTALP